MRKKPDAVKKLGGTYRQDRASGSLKPEIGIPACPVHLSLEGQKVWDALCGKLVDMGVLTGFDGYVLSMFCETFTRWNTLRQYLQEHGDSYQSETGLCKIRPEVQSLKECLASLDVLSAKFGLSPRDREKLTVRPQEEPDEFEEFLARGREISAQKKG